MKFDFLVKHNGVYYKAGEEVPTEVKASVGASKPIEVKKDEPIVEKKAVETPKYTKTDINRMSTKELKDLANANGIDGDKYVGSELKSMLIEKLL